MARFGSLGVRDRRSAAPSEKASRISWARPFGVLIVEGPLHTMSHMADKGTTLAIDLFCGCGGISAGLRDAGFHVIAGADIEPNYICTFRHNFPDAHAVTDDLTRLDPSEFMRRFDLRVGQLGILAGGPPC